MRKDDVDYNPIPVFVNGVGMIELYHWTAPTLVTRAIMHHVLITNASHVCRECRPTSIDHGGQAMAASPP